MSFHRFAVELSLVTLALWLQSAGVATLIAWVRRALQGDSTQWTPFGWLHLLCDWQ